MRLALLLCRDSTGLIGRLAKGVAIVSGRKKILDMNMEYLLIGTENRNVRVCNTPYTVCIFDIL